MSWLVTVFLVMAVICFVSELRSLGVVLLLSAGYFYVAPILQAANKVLASPGELKVALNRPEGGFTVMNSMGRVLEERPGSDCAEVDESYHVCSLTLPAGLYRIRFTGIEGFEKLAESEVCLDGRGRTVYGSYFGK
ncbi:hypothetical protein JXD20_01585 [Candidatus Peregrinibacteria bacterium]|nr:hypothetical protein [Candidatus Peregrinibacteria bacterium]